MVFYPKMVYNLSTLALWQQQKLVCLRHEKTELKTYLNDLLLQKHKEMKVYNSSKKNLW